MRGLRLGLGVGLCGALAGLAVAGWLRAPAPPPAPRAPAPRWPSGRAQVALDEAARLARVGALERALRVLELAQAELTRDADLALLAHERDALLARQEAAQTVPRPRPPAVDPGEVELRELRTRLRLQVLDPGLEVAPAEVPTEVLVARFERGDGGSSAARAELLRRGPAALLVVRAALERRPQASWLASLADELE